MGTPVTASHPFVGIGVGVGVLVGIGVGVAVGGWAVQQAKSATVIGGTHEKVDNTQDSILHPHEQQQTGVGVGADVGGVPVTGTGVFVG